MKLWLCNRINFPAGTYDEYAGFVIRAENEQEARIIASMGPLRYRQDERWLDAAFASCIEITTAGESGIILEDFRAG